MSASKKRLPKQLVQLTASAKTASQNAYAPYSKFPVGAAILASSGKIYAGTNVENASYGLTNCAERSALFAAIAAGERNFTCLAIHTPTGTPTAPCGACRQVLNEFAPSLRILSTCNTPAILDTPLSSLLPHPFGPQNLSPRSEP